MAALIGAAMFALINDIAARSGSSSPASAFSSSRESCLYSSGIVLLSLLVGGPRRVLRRDGCAAAAHVRRLATLANIRSDRRIEIAYEINAVGGAADTPLDDLAEPHIQRFCPNCLVQTVGSWRPLSA